MKRKLHSVAVVKGSLLSKQEKKTKGAPPPGDISVPPPFSPPSIPYIVYQTVKARRRKGKRWLATAFVASGCGGMTKIYL